MIYRDECYRIVGACFEVYNRMGCGFLEDVYQECLAIEFEVQEIPFMEKPKQELAYRGRTLEQFYKPDFVCFGKIIVELKTASSFCSEDYAQVLNYLNATSFQLGLLVNFGHHPKLEYKRVILTRDRTWEADSEPSLN